VAETSGFATDLPQSAYLAHTIRRGIAAAEQRSHRYVTLEHLLLALLDDPDALSLMEVARTDVAALRSAATETVNHSLATLYTPGTFDLHASYKVERVLQSASDDARRMGCTEVDGAFVVVALFHETDSAAYDLLKRHNFVFHAANSWLDRNRGAPRQRYAPPPPQAPAPPAEEFARRQPEPAPGFSPFPAQTQDEDEAELLDEAEVESLDDADEILLEEISDDDEAVPVRSPSGGPAPSPQLPPYFQQQMQRGETPPPPRPSRVPPPRDDRKGGDDRGAYLEPALPSRPLPERRPPQAQSGSDLGSAVPARGPAAPTGWELTNAGPRHAEPPPIPAGRPNADPRGLGVPAAEAGRTEPRLPSGAGRGRGLGAAVPGRVAEPGLSDGPALRPQFEPPASGGGATDLGLAVPGREMSSHGMSESDMSAPGMDASGTGAPGMNSPPLGGTGRPMEPAESRPPRPHASARERSITRPPAPAPVAAEATPAPSSSTMRGPGPGGPAAPAPAERRAPPQFAPPSAAGRIEPSLPSPNRLDDMRVRPTAPTPPPAPAAPASAPASGKSAKKTAAASKEAGDKPRPRRRQPSAGSVYTGKLAENIPRKMRAFKPERVEVRITREETETFLAGMEGTGESVRHDLLVTQAMSVLLRAPDGGFTIETIAPETQWIFSHPGGVEKEPFGRWRWSVTPTEKGSFRLQLVVSTRSVDQNGLAGDTVLPDQVITVSVRTNYGRAIMGALRWIVLMALGGAITEGVVQVMRLLEKG